MSTHTVVSWAKSNEIRVEALKRLAETADHGCEAASARAFEEGRLAALDALGLGYREPGSTTDVEIQHRRLDLDDALRFEPIIRGDQPQRLINHRPNCSLRMLFRGGSAAMTCTCDYWSRLSQQRQPSPSVE